MIEYAGAPSPIRTRWGSLGWEELTDGVIVAAQPSGAPTWFPSNDRVDDKAAYSIRISADQAYTVIGNGTLVESPRRLRARALALRAGAADRDLPGDRADRPVRAAHDRRGRESPG